VPFVKSCCASPLGTASCPITGETRESPKKLVRGGSTAVAARSELIGFEIERRVPMKRSLINQSKPGSGQEPTNKQRRALIGGALAALLSSPRRLMAQGTAVHNDPFLLLLKGVYQPVVPGTGPDLGLSVVNLNDGSYSTTQIHTVTRIPGSPNEDNAVVGHFFAQLNAALAGALVVLCAYQLPGGAIAMQFTGGGFPTQISDGQGGMYLEGTFELAILEATGIYSSFVGGHNHMVDRLHKLNDGSFDENCYCIISLPSSLPLWWSSN
jgi:hypothetical protein